MKGNSVQGTHNSCPYTFLSMEPLPHIVPLQICPNNSYIPIVLTGCQALVLGIY